VHEMRVTNFVLMERRSLDIVYPFLNNSAE
jgi:hypothetical protein